MLMKLNYILNFMRCIEYKSVEAQVTL